MVTAVAGPAWLRRPDLASLIAALREDGRRVIGPTIRDGAISYDEIATIDDLPTGWRDVQAPGRYRLAQADEADGRDRTFAFTVGPTSPKGFSFPARVPVGRAAERNGSLAFEAVTPDAPRLAFIGLRACELAALGIQDRVLRDGPVPDPDYAARRRDNFIVAVECTVAGATCFCTSMGTGPEVNPTDADLTLTEGDGGFVVRAGTDAGRALAERLPLEPVDEDRLAAARAAVSLVRERIGDPVARTGLPARLRAQAEHPRWAEIAERCLGCANCTLVCPTCFCTSVSTSADLAGTVATTERAWDSCFSGDFAKVAGGDFRPQPKDRYRQWLTHKFSTWVDQFGSFGCVGCGRCVTWCPVGIDVREELAIIAPPPPPPIPRAALAPDAGPAVATAPGDFVTARIDAIAPETADTTTLTLRDVDPAIRAGRPGQFVMATRPGLPAVPISVSRYGPRPDAIDLSIRAAGPATATITALGPGAELGLRGPLGRPWPVEAADGRDVVVVAGGIGLSPLRSLVDALLGERGRFGTIRLFHGARTPADRPHTEDLERWAARGDIEVAVTVDRAGPGWSGPVGVVTHLFDDARWDGREAVGYVCGPERMMQASAATLLDRGLRPERIFVSLERHMECGVGLCGHCQLGPFFVCRDGPVFSLAELGADFTREGV